ncbi:MAG TPA: hypothetical protein VLO00_10045, partial [Cryobacterium sp.]|nr:hypothetical protein [Cryobacterium sp.]
SVPTTTAGLFVVTPANPARAAAVAASVSSSSPASPSSELQPAAFAPSAAGGPDGASSARTDDSATEPDPSGTRPSAAAPDASAPDVAVPELLPPVEAPAPLMVPGGVGPDESEVSRGIRSENVDLAPAPWWTSFAQAPLELTAEEIAAADLLAGRTPPAPAPEPTPLPAPVSARDRLRARLAASLSAPATLAGQTPESAPAVPASGARAVTRLAEVAAQASAALRAAVAPADTAVSPPVAATPAQPAAAGAPASVGTGSREPAPAGSAAAAAARTETSPAGVTPLASSVTTGPVSDPAPRPAAGTTYAASKAAPRSALSANASTNAGTNARVAATAPRASSAAPGSGSGAARPASAGRPPGSRRPGNPRLLVWIAGGLVLVLALTALFFLGQSLAGGGDAAPVAVPTSSATPGATPSASPAATGPQPVGEHPWDSLFGGECLQPYGTPWDEEFTVADCAAPHAAQLVYRGSFAGDAATAFPGEAELAGQINLLCSAPGVIDLAAAGSYDDVQVQGSYPITEEQWSAEARYYYCFVSRASGEPLTASVAGPGPAPAA